MRSHLFFALRETWVIGTYLEFLLLIDVCCLLLELWLNHWLPKYCVQHAGKAPWGSLSRFKHTNSCELWLPWNARLMGQIPDRICKSVTLNYWAGQPHPYCARWWISVTKVVIFNNLATDQWQKLVYAAWTSVSCSWLKCQTGPLAAHVTRPSTCHFYQHNYKLPCHCENHLIVPVCGVAPPKFCGVRGSSLVLGAAQEHACHRMVSCLEAGCAR